MRFKRFVSIEQATLSLTLSLSMEQDMRKLVSSTIYSMCIDFNKANDIHMISTNGAASHSLLIQIAAESLDACGELLQCLLGHATEYTLLGAGILVFQDLHTLAQQINGLNETCT